MIFFCVLDCIIMSISTALYCRFLCPVDISLRMSLVLAPMLDCPKSGACLFPKKCASWGWAGRGISLLPLGVFDLHGDLFMLKPKIALALPFVLPLGVLSLSVFLLGYSGQLCDRVSSSSSGAGRTSSVTTGSWNRELLCSGAAWARLYEPRFSLSSYLTKD